jgi:hypothetical protein
VNNGFRPLGRINIAGSIDDDFFNCHRDFSLCPGDCPDIGDYTASPATGVGWHVAQRSGSPVKFTPFHEAAADNQWSVVPRPSRSPQCLVSPGGSNPLETCFLVDRALRRFRDVRSMPGAAGTNFTAGFIYP